MFTNLKGRIRIFVSLLLLVQKFPMLFVQEVLQVGDGHQGLVEGRGRGGRCLARLEWTRLIAFSLLEGAEKTQGETVLHLHTRWNKTLKAKLK